MIAAARSLPNTSGTSRALMYFLANDPRVPDDVREPMSRWGPGQVTNSPTTATGPTRSTSGKPDAWSDPT